MLYLESGHSKKSSGKIAKPRRRVAMLQASKATRDLESMQADYECDDNVLYSAVPGSQMVALMRRWTLSDE